MTRATSAQKPKVSIIVPIYNVEKYLRECLESLVTQTLHEIEIICIDDGSTDGSSAILDAYAEKDDRIKVIRKPNSGYGAACNLGLNQATADYVGIIESDDFADKNLFADLYALAIESGCDLVKCEWWNYTGKNGRTEKSSKISSSLKTGVIASVEEKKKLLKIPATVWAALYKKQFLNENNIRFLETPGASFQDTSFNFKVIAQAKDIYITDRAYVYYRQDSVDKSTLRKDGGEFIFKEYEEIDRLLNANSELKRAYKGVKFRQQYRAYLWNFQRVAPEYRIEVFEKFANQFRRYAENQELDEAAFEFLNKKTVDLILYSPEKARKKLQPTFWATTFKEFRRNFFSIRINSKRVSIVAFGKEIVRI